MSNNLVAINEFVKRQKPNSGKTYTSMTFKELAEYAEEELLKKSYTNGYRDGVILINVSKDLLKFFKCPFVKINEKTKLKAEITKRRSNEEYYIRIKAINGTELAPGKVQLILYRNDVLRETNENTNDLFPQYFPKNRDFRTITDSEIIHTMKRLNNRPRKRLGYKTPNQVFFEESYNVALTT